MNTKNVIKVYKELILKRLKKPSVIISICSQFASILVILGFNINSRLVTAIATSVCSILVLLGILSNPTSIKKGYEDDIRLCKKCNKKSVHVCINGRCLCQECGYDAGSINIIEGKDNNTQIILSPMEEQIGVESNKVEEVTNDMNIEDTTENDIEDTNDVNTE